MSARDTERQLRQRLAVIREIQARDRPWSERVRYFEASIRPGELLELIGWLDQLAGLPPVELLVEPITNATPIDLLILSGRTRNVLLRNDFRTVGEVVERFDELPQIDGLGKMSIAEIREQVRDLL